MGHNTKKKRRGSGRKGKGRPPSGDPSTIDDQDLLSEELTALSAIFQEDIQILSHSPYPHFTINLTPHSDDTGNENNNVSAILSVRCLPGYPSKCPKLQVIPDKGLKPDDVDRLLSLLLDQVATDIATHFFLSDHIDIRLNHGQILAAIWTWVGVEETLRQSVSDVLSSLSSYAPQSAKRKSHWALIRRQLLQGLNLVKSVVDRLQAVDLRFCGPPDQSLARIRGALSPDMFTCKALDEIAALISYLRIWKIEKNISLDVLMPPEESYYRGLIFQIYVINDGNVGSMTERNLLAFGGCYDHLVQTMWDHKLTPPSAAGVSIALEKIVLHPLVDIKPLRNESCTTVLVCSRGGGGLLEERMELVSELWEANIKADFIPIHGCSLTMHYDYANEHDIKLLIIITEAGLSQTGSFEVRNLELKKEKKVERSQLIRFITDALSSQFRSFSVWN